MRLDSTGERHPHHAQVMRVFTVGLLGPSPARVAQQVHADRPGIVRPDGSKLAWELETCDVTLNRELGIVPKDFAFIGTSWSSEAERQVSGRYRFGRLWFVGTHYQADGEEVRLADLLGVEGEDEPGGGPPMSARYVTKEPHPYRLPSIEIQRDLIYRPEAFRAYLEGAL